MPGRVVVLGAGGRTGAACVETLAAQGKPVAAVVSTLWGPRGRLKHCCAGCCMGTPPGCCPVVRLASGSLVMSCALLHLFADEHKCTASSPEAGARPRQVSGL